MLARQRSPMLPDLPTADEQGVKDFEAFTWNAMFLPPATPATIVTKLNAAMNEVLETPAVRERLDSAGLVVPPRERRSPEYLKRYVASEIEKWGAPIRASGATAE
jgi:tripartite-type tricarboxylate transporter receptor subunit TctC